MIFKRLCLACFNNYLSVTKTVNIRPIRFIRTSVRVYKTKSREPIQQTDDHDVIIKPNISTELKSESHLKLRFIYVQTCVGYWDDVVDGVMFDVGYVDSHPEDHHTNKDQMPTILALHNTPGSHEDLLPIMESFVKMGCRVVIPNFPGVRHTTGIAHQHEDIFTHSMEERAQFITDFLENIDLKRIDMFIGYGASCFQLLRLCSSKVTKSNIKSAIFLSPWPLSESRSQFEVAVQNMMLWMWERSFYRLLVYVFISIGRLFSKDYKSLSVREVITKCYTHRGIDYAEACGLAATIAHSQLPKLIVYGKKDNLSSAVSTEEFMENVGIPSYTLQDKQEVKHLDNEDEYPQSLVLEDSRHILHKDFQSTIITTLWKFLKHIRPEIR